MTKPEKLLEDMRVVPVVVIEDPDTAVPLAETLLAAGLLFLLTYISAQLVAGVLTARWPEILPENSGISSITR